MKFVSLVLISVSLLSSATFAKPVCFELSRDGNLWSRTPELLCVDEDNQKAKITLETGLFNRQVVAEFRLDLLVRARCIDCNKDVFGLANPSNSIFNTLKIEFDGEGMINEQEGTVSIGENLFFYRSFK